ncbi:EAL domain-containing protein [Achromobacter sp. KS-M25]|nr:EAL domain-containing protein [Achromobacter aestuarii]
MFKRRPLPFYFALILFCAAVTIPLWLSATWAHDQAERQYRADVDLFARRALHRAEDVIQRSKNALDELSGFRDTGCTPPHLAALRRVAYEYRYVSSVAYYQGSRAVCASNSDERELPVLDTPDWRTRDGVSIWFSAHNPTGLNRRMVNFRRDNHVIVVDPLSYVDVLGNTAEMALAVVSVPTSQVVARWETSNPAPLLAAALRGESSTHEGRYFTVQKSSALPIAVVASVPLGTIENAWREQMLIWVPMGLICGIFGGWGALSLLRRYQSLGYQLQAAVQRGDLEVHYQPIVDMHAQRCVGAEALVRWPLGDGTWMKPDVFIPLAEQSGAIVDITALVVARIAADLGPFLADRPNVRISFNVSPPDISRDGMPDVLDQAMARSGIRPEQLCLEVTERGFFDPALARDQLQAIRDAGHSVYIDDFGTGYSSLAYLQNLPVDVLKIDKRFVDTVGTESASSTVADHIIAMAQDLGLTLIAEGIETTAQADYLLARGVQYGQGWLFSRALPAAAFRRYADALNGT